MSCNMALRVILLLVMAFLAQSDRVSERKVSSWPRGNYGLLSTVYGCPETSEYGWQTGYINLTSTGSRTAYHDWSDSLHLLGPYHLHTIQLNFCMRADDLDTEDDEILNVTENRTASSNIWPHGHYCIFQGDADCPSEFNTSFLTLRDYAIINDDIEGQLPNMTFNGNEVVVTLCCRSDEDANSTMALPSVFPFYLIKPQSEVPCQPVGGTEVFEETFAFIHSTNMSQDELEPHENDTLALSLCFYKPYERRECAFFEDLGSSYRGRHRVHNLGYECEYWADNGWPSTDTDYIMGNLEENYCRKAAWNWRFLVCKHKTTMAFCVSVPLCDVSEDLPNVAFKKAARSSKAKLGNSTENALDGKIRMDCDWYLILVKACLADPEGPASFATEPDLVEPWFQVDLQRHFLVQAVVIVRAEEEKPYNARHMMTFVSVRQWDFFTSGSPVCEGPTNLGRNNVYRFECVRPLTGQYVTIQNNVASHSGRDYPPEFIFELSEVKIRAKALTCGLPMGMLSGVIQDAQIASSSTASDSLPPRNARLNQPAGWCASDADSNPYIQVDLLTSVTVQGVVVQGWTEEGADHKMPDSFTVLHGLAPDTLTPYLDGRGQVRTFHVDSSLAPDFPQSFLFVESIFTRIIRMHLNCQACVKLELIGCPEQDIQSKEGCYTVVRDSGEITSPSFPFYYGEGVHCVWDVEFPAQSQIKLEILNLTLPGKEGRSMQVGVYEAMNADCEDALIVEDVLETREVLFVVTGKNYSRHQRSEIISSSNKVKVTLMSCMRMSRVSSLSGFRIKLSVYECKPGFRAFNGHCYLFKQEQTGLTWFEAEDRCVGHGSHLVSINSASEMQYIHTVIVISDTVRQKEAYIGLRKRSAREFEWTSGEALTYTDWYFDPESQVAQPDGGDRELCVMLRMTDVRRTAIWHDVVCAFDRVQQYVCEMPQIQVDPVPDGAVRNVSFNATAQRTGYYFRCNNSEYISRTLWCDGRMDCTDGSDERSCDVSCPSRFKCDNGRCLAFTLLCDYKDDCGDQSDERQCASLACRADEWMCANGQCIPRSDRCDLNTQCQDGSDEDMCDVCPEPAFQCYHGLCIHEANVCDGHIDCGGVYNEDEGASCRIRAHPSCGAWHALGARDNGAYTLTDGDGGTFPVECIFDHSRDRVATVIHHDQEDMVVMDTISAAQHHITYNSAMDSVMYVLQGSQSCSQRVDVDCQYVYRAMSNSISWLDVKGDRHLFYNSSKPNCSCELEYACDMGQERCFCDVIVQQAWNMLPDTSRLHDHGDIVDKQLLPVSGINISVVNEYGSIRFTVGPLVCVEEKHNVTTQMMCKSGITADVATRCVLDYNQHGGVVGCRDLTHLLDCGEFVCPMNYMKCPDSFCLPLRRVCDGHRDCLDGRDEQQCDSWVCPNLFRCGDGGTCLTWDQVCDGREHCPRGDDERGCDPTCPEGCTCQDMTTRCQHLSLDVASAIPHDTKNLDLSRIDIPDFENYSFNGLDSLLYLNLSDCGILDLTNTSFVDLISLMYLDLSNNLITSLVENVFFGVRNLKHLILSGNKMLSYISPGAFNGLWNLPVLDLSGLSVANLQENVFSGLTNLKRLNLSNTGLVAVETGAFSELDNLISLDLRMNTIKSFDGGVFSGLTGLQDLVTDAYEFCCIRPISVTQAKCLPPPDEFSSCSDLMKNVTLRISLWVLGAVALLGNSIVLFYRLIYDRAGLKRNNGIYVANLGVSDFLMGVYMFIIAGADTHFRGWYNWNDTWWRESELCQLAGFLSTLSSEVSTIFLCIITIDRLVALKSPLSVFAQNSKLACVACVVTWLCGLALAGVPLLPLEYFRGRFYSRSGVCLALPLTRDKPPGWEYATAVFVVFNFLCFVVIAVGQAGIYRDIRGRPEVTVQKGDVQLARKLSLIVMSDFLCWFPICVMGLMAMRGHVIPGEVYTWTAAFILPINSALNPLLYTLSSATSTNLRRKIVRGVLGSGRSNPLSSANVSTRISESRGISRRRHRGWQPSDADAVKTPDGAVSLRTAILAGLDVTEMLYICQGVTRSLEVMHSHHLACTSLSEDCVVIFYKQGMMTQVGISDEMTPIKDGNNPSHDVQQLGHMVQLMLTMGKRDIQ